MIKEKYEMQLKKIIIKGFKSFPDKTILNFDDGVTSIVGPNGSGKSNIIEAIRWVMGEQSAKTLRGNRMDDVIFSGTHQRKAINIAEVELILDNSDQYLSIDYEEVSILRRLSRSSGSTYKINQQECRLKDIVDLFMDSGLGKESFSVISQGEVEAVFNSKAEERRGIFEEAAGVFKYKVRKEDAKKKLDQTEDNLDRVRDILYELESQLEPLREQADIAKSYLNRKEKLTDLDISLSVSQIKSLNKKIKKNKREEKKLANQLEEVEKQLNVLEEKRSKKQLNIEANRKKFDDLNKKIIKIVRKKERIEASFQLFDEKNKHQKEFIQEKKKSIQDLNIRNKEEEKKLIQIEKNYREERKALQAVDQKIQDLEKQRSYLEKNQSVRIEELRIQYIDHLQKQTSLKNQYSYLEQEFSRNEIEKKKKEEKVLELKREIKESKKNLKEKKEKKELLKEELNSLSNEYQEKNKFLEKFKDKIGIVGQRISDTSNELEKAKAKKISLEEMQENYTRYYAGVRAVMREKAKLSGIISTVAESIEIPKDYLLAINTALGSSSQFVIVENEKDAQVAIQYLKSNKKGRATFLPLTNIRPLNIPRHRIETIKKMTGYLGIASDLVKNDERVGSIIENLLGRTILADTLSNANKIARAIRFSNRVVSIEGDIINAGGSMTGGGRQNNLNPIFSQKAELNHLKEIIQTKRKFLYELTKEQKDLKDRKEILNKKVESIRLVAEEKRLTEQKTKSQWKNFNESFNRISRELEASSFELKEKIELGKEYKEKLVSLNKSLKEIKKIVEKANKNMELLTDEQESMDSKREQIYFKLENTRENRNTIREKIAREITRKEHSEYLIKENKDQMKQLENDMKSFNQDFSLSSKKEIEASFEEHCQKELKLEEKQKEIESQIQKMTVENENLTKKMEQANNRLKFLNDKKGKLTIELSKDDVKIDYLLDYLVEEYKISFEEARINSKLEIDFKEAKKRVRLLKKEIDELGPVNLNSIDEFKNINERYEFLSGQQSDLIEAKNTLFNTMDEMDLIVEKYFKETFDLVKKEFAKVFPKMFGGGHAELILTDPNNLLETGIEITAQPPGKKLTQMSLLSGGERSLTAISLLFSIIQVNPIPFVILDEAEAALDDANVIRFGQYLQNFQEDTQFIVITHRKGTMEQSDQLYGITMQEKGVSKIVGVSLKEASKIEGVT